MVTRSTFSSFNSNDISPNIIPPWCASGRISRRKTRRDFTLGLEMRSSDILHQNIWDCLHDDKDSRNFTETKGKTAKNYSKQLQYKHKRRGKNFFKLLIFLFLVVGCTMTFWKYDLVPSRELIQKVFKKTDFILFPSMNQTTSVDTNCYRRMGHLAEELSRAQRALRATLRLRRTLLHTHTSIPEFNHKSVMQRGYIAGARASKGSDTREWGGRVALWGILPLWRASPPPDTVLALRTPTPSDCWPFSGSYGEVVIELALRARLSHVGIEHVRPDTARSAPKNFVLYNILENNTRVETARGTYTYNKPAKQYFPLSTSVPAKGVAFRVLSNQGNQKYTCLYRVHLYGITIDTNQNIL